MPSIEIKMIVTKKYTLSKDFDKDDFGLFEDKLNVLTNKANADKIDAIGHFLYADKPSSEEPDNSDYDSVKFLGVIKND